MYWMLDWISSSGCRPSSIFTPTSSSPPHNPTICLVDIQQRRPRVRDRSGARHLGERGKYIQLCNQCRKSVEKRNVRKSHFYDVLNHLLLRLYVLALVLLVLARRRSQITTVKNTPDFSLLPIDREMNSVLQHLQHTHVRNRIHLVVEATGGAETVSEPWVVFALQINLGVPRRILLVNLRRLSNFAVQRHDFVVGFVAFQRDRGERFVVVRVDHEFGRRQQ